MRVLHWYPNFLGGGAVANTVRMLASAQSELGADVRIMAAETTRPPLYAMLKTPSVPVLPWRPRWTVKMGRIAVRGVPNSAKSEIARFKPDVVHIHGEFNPDNLWVPKLVDVPVVLSPHGGLHALTLAKGRALAKRLYLRVASRRLFRHVSAFHALSPIERKDIERLFPSAPVYSAPNGINVGVAGHLQLAQRCEEDAVRLVFLGRLAIHAKGIDILLDALAIVKSQLSVPKFMLKLIGPDQSNGSDWILRRAVELEIADCVMCTGIVSADRAAEHLRESDIYVHLARREAFSLAVAEALGLGKPAVVSNKVGAVSYPEISSLPYVRVVAPDAKAAACALVEMIKGLDVLARVGPQCAPNVADFFCWERAAKIHLETYQKIGAGADQFCSRRC